MTECEDAAHDLASPGHASAVAERISTSSESPAQVDLLAHSRLLDSVAAFTHHRDTDALDRSLVLSLAELASARSVSLAKCGIDRHPRVDSIVECTPDTQGNYRLQVLGADESDPATALLSRCMEHQEAHAEMRDGVQRLIVPILCEGRAIGALQLDSTVSLSVSRPLTDGFARIYANYTALLSESERDKLTGLYNRRNFERHLQRLLRQREQMLHAVGSAGQHGDAPMPGEAQVWLAILDIDQFKRINDSYGHIYGDEVILLLAQQMRACFRQSDVLFRFGGEEFVILFSAIDEATVHAVLERFRKHVAEHVFPQVGYITVSIGYACVGSHDYPATVLDRADKALYFAKENGRNSIYGYESLNTRGMLGQTLAAGSIDLF
ncbi:GGDEF domain-containing protein [Rhodanobacter koreensis]